MGEVACLYYKILHTKEDSRVGAVREYFGDLCQ